MSQQSSTRSNVLQFNTAHSFARGRAAARLEVLFEELEAIHAVYGAPNQGLELLVASAGRQPERTRAIGETGAAQCAGSRRLTPTRADFR